MVYGINKMHKFYYTYKITLLKGSLAGHYYFGQHRTNNLNDGYAGSGKIIKDYFKHYDKVEGLTYVKEILHFYNDNDELNIAEKQLIGDKFENDKLCLNLKPGGMGNYNGAKQGHTVSEETKEKLRQANLNRPEEIRKKFGQSQRGKAPWNKGTKTPEETKQKLRKKHNLSSEQHNKLSEWAKSFIWINNGIEVKHINKEDFEKYKNLGYERGRKIA